MFGRRIYVDCFSPIYRIALLEKEKLFEVIFQEKSSKISVSDIYLGRVEKTLPNGICFVEIGKGEKVFLQESNKKIKNGSEILLQITKEAFDKKCAVATSEISVSGRFCVVVKDKRECGVSKRILDDGKREKLREIAKENCLEGHSVVIRTGAENATEEEIEKEIKKLNLKILEIEKTAEFAKAPFTLFKNENQIVDHIRRFGFFDEIVVNSKEMFKILDGEFENVVLYEEKVPMFNKFLIEGQIEKLFHKKVWLKSGAYLVIDEVEAMTVIDINSGKAIKGTNINKEAVFEIARQIRLRNLNGIIIIDFINTETKEEKEEIISLLKKELSKDSTKSIVYNFTELGLLQISREKVRKPLSKYIFHPCSCCDGSGVIKDVVFIGCEITNNLVSLFEDTIYNYVEIQANKTIIEYLEKTLSEIEKKYCVKIVPKIITTSRFDYYKIEKRRI